MTRHKTQGIIFDYKIAAKSGYLVSRMYIMILGSKGQNVVLACKIRHLNLGPAKHEEVAIYAVNMRIPNVYRIARVTL